MSTRRLELRPAGLSDLGVLVQHWNDPQVRRYLFDDREVSPKLAETLLRDSEADFARHGYGLWKVVKDDVLIGVCGLRRRGEERVEILYSLDPGHWGAGLAAEAAEAVLGAGRRARLTEVLIETDDGNLASHRLADRLGAVFEGAADGRRRYTLTL
ncbi:Protein N-acetyltransferase, RimJ/RimL family [Nonomuraea solani]|uniref:Protein N-acetyltransferase, RimJ/RimL family n=1 Tax=Nonomuraea solani TaxID=1144553 RepID=A0A1H6BFP7_9ACTN|nr:GNAT family N-acetyltransferase [Nonomuraea solani]SEG59601.1 Protein N-acetyltransferase, RimJ/RimL family [Nonomuraea solani]